MTVRAPCVFLCKTTHTLEKGVGEGWERTQERFGGGWGWGGDVLLISAGLALWTWFDQDAGLVMVVSKPVPLLNLKVTHVWDFYLCMCPRTFPHPPLSFCFPCLRVLTWLFGDSVRTWKEWQFASLFLSYFSFTVVAWFIYNANHDRVSGRMCSCFVFFFLGGGGEGKIYFYIPLFLSSFLIYAVRHKKQNQQKKTNTPTNQPTSPLVHNLVSYIKGWLGSC